MGRKTAAFGLRLGAGLVFVAMIVAANFGSTPAAAQGNCPPGQIFVPLENKCVGLGGVSHPDVAQGSRPEFWRGI
jgi:hypothetical protein